MKKFKITVGDKIFDVMVEEDLSPGRFATGPATSFVGSSSVVAPQISVPAGKISSAPKGTSGGSAVRSPLSGKVVAVDVAPGEEVGEADILLTLEAMKMNTHVYAPKGGRVGDILVAVGDAVEEGQELLRLV